MFQRKKLSLAALPEISVPTKVEEASWKSLVPQSRSDVLYGLTRPEIYSLCKIKGKIKTTNWKTLFKAPPNNHIVTNLQNSARPKWKHILKAYTYLDQAPQ